MKKGDVLKIEDVKQLIIKAMEIIFDDGADTSQLLYEVTGIKAIFRPATNDWIVEAVS